MPITIPTQQTAEVPTSQAPEGLPVKISRKPLMAAEEAVIRKKIRDLEDILNEAEIVQGVNHKASNKQAIQAEKQRLEHILLTRSVQEATGNDRLAIEREVKALQEDLQKGMPSWNEFMNTTRKHGMNYVKLRNWILKCESDPERRRKIERWKYLKRRLDPTDPDASNTMQLFPDR
jgi:hypothetical protein